MLIYFYKTVYIHIFILKSVRNCEFWTKNRINLLIQSKYFSKINNNKIYKGLVINKFSCSWIV